MDEGFPKKRWIILQNEGRTTGKLLLSFHRLELSSVQLGDLGGANANAATLSPLVQQALLHSQYESEARGEPMNLNFDALDDLEKLRIFARVLEGPLQQLSPYGGHWTPRYFKPAEGSKSHYWYWDYWNSREDFMRGSVREGRYNLLAVSLVLPDAHDRQCFYIKYHTPDGVHDLIFRRVDRDRNIWSEGLYEFIDRLRSYLDRHPQPSPALKFLKKKARKNRAMSDDAHTRSAAKPIPNSAAHFNHRRRLSLNQQTNTSPVPTPTNTVSPMAACTAADYSMDANANRDSPIDASTGDAFPMTTTTNLLSHSQSRRLTSPAARIQFPLPRPPTYYYSNPTQDENLPFSKFSFNPNDPLESAKEPKTTGTVVAIDL
eukprot:GHVT01035615.1.p1 GENE.GHVT01035615.1~~GHVT01035615.1.p1  ORF type:complete len:375 (+),score=44.07 GHVT01035615.1:475-1599(+)